MKQIDLRLLLRLRPKLCTHENYVVQPKMIFLCSQEENITFRDLRSSVKKHFLCMRQMLFGVCLSFSLLKGNKPLNWTKLKTAIIIFTKKKKNSCIAFYNLQSLFSFVFFWFWHVVALRTVLFLILKMENLMFWWADTSLWEQANKRQRDFFPPQNCGLRWFFLLKVFWDGDFFFFFFP